MPKRKRIQRQHTEDWQTIQQYTLWPEQTAYELLRPLVLFGDPAGKCAQETGAAERTLNRKAPRVVTLEIANEIRKKTEDGRQYAARF